MTGIDSLNVFRWASLSALARKELACLTTNLLERRPIFRYCETCLAADPIPFFRMLWRFAGAYVCPLHGSVLRDCCPHCFTYIDLSVPGKGVPRSVRRCMACGGDLCATPSIFLPDDIYWPVLATQGQLLEFLNRSSHIAVPNNYWYPDPATLITATDNGQIDPTQKTNAHVLFERLLGSLLEKERPKLNQEVATNELRAILRIRAFRMKRSTTTLALSLDRTKMFGAVARFIAMHLRSCQDIDDGSEWWTIGRGIEIDRKDVLTNEKLALARKWVISLGRSRVGRHF